MKPKTLFYSSLIAAAAMSTVPAWAVSSYVSSYDSENKKINWYSADNAAYKWVGSSSGAFSTASNWVTGTNLNGTPSWSTTNSAPARVVSNDIEYGYLLYFDGTSQTISVSGGTSGNKVDTSDGGGIWVAGTGNTVTASMGQWSGSIQVEAGNVLNTSWTTVDSSRMFKDGHIVAKGTVNITSGNLNLDGDTARTWFVGVDGSITFGTATTISTTKGTGSITLLGEVDTLSSGITNRTSTGTTTLTKQLVTFSSSTGITSGLDLLKVGTDAISDAGTGKALESVSSADNLTVGQYYAEKSSSGVTVSYAVNSYDAVTLTWAGTDSSSVWVNKGDNWTNASGVKTSFLNGDTVTFAASDTASKTVSVVGAKEVQAVNVTGGDYTFTGTGGSLAVRGALTVSSGASLTLSNGVLGTVSGGISLGSDATLKLVGTSSGGLTNVVSGSGTVVLDRGSAPDEPQITKANVLTDNIAVEKTGTGKISIYAAQSYTGGTTISAGNLGVGNNEALGTGTITLNGGQITAQTTGLNFDNAVVIGSGNGTIHTQSYTMTFSGKISGTGTLTKQGTNGGTLNFSINTLNNSSFSEGAKIIVNVGTVMFGANAQTISTDSFGENLTVEVASGAQATFAIAQSTTKGYAGNLTLKNGATYRKYDGGIDFSGSVTLGESDSDTVYLLGNWGKDGTKISGVLSGAGTAYFGAESNSTLEKLTISGSDNSYSGEIIVGKKNATTNSSKSTALVLTATTALAHGNVNLAGVSESSYSELTLGNTAITIAGLSGTQYGRIALADGTSASTLTVVSATDKEFAGTIGNGVSLVKQGTGTLKLSGDNSANASDVTVNAGVLEVANASALGSSGTTTVNEGGVLKVSVNGGVNAGTGAVKFASGAKFAVDLTKYTVEVDKALSIITASAISFNNQNLGSVTLTSEEIEKYFSATDSVLGDWATGYTRKWGYDTTNSALTLTLITVPEPSTFGLLAGVGALAFVAARRRRRAK